MFTPRERAWPGLLMVAVLIVIGAGSLLHVLKAPTEAKPDYLRVPYASTEAVAFDYAPFDRVCKRFVDDVGMVDYAALKDDPADLEAFLEQVAAVSPHSNIVVFTSEREALAYWINAYNAWMMKAVLDATPIDSVMDISSDPGVFDAPGRICGGEDLSLNQIEHGIIREEFPDPRVHFALNCASMSCPWLPAEVFHPARLDEQLDRETRRFLAEPEHLRVDPETRTVHLSRILDWYSEDFLVWLRDYEGLKDPSLVEYVKPYAPDGTPEFDADYEVEFQPYDWRLNDQNAEWAVLRQGD